jgi:hypothetical protein
MVGFWCYFNVFVWFAFRKADFQFFWVCALFVKGDL